MEFITIHGRQFPINPDLQDVLTKEEKDAGAIAFEGDISTLVEFKERMLVGIEDESGSTNSKD